MKTAPWIAMLALALACSANPPAPPGVPQQLVDGAAAASCTFMHWGEPIGTIFASCWGGYEKLGADFIADVELFAAKHATPGHPAAVSYATDARVLASMSACRARELAGVDAAAVDAARER